MNKNVSPEAMKIILEMQQNELTESVIYQKIAKFAKGEENKKTLLRLAEEEKKHYEIWKLYSGKELKPQKAKVAKCKYWHENDVLPIQTAAGLTKTMAPRDSVTLDTYEIDIPKSDVHDFYRNFVSAIDGKCTQLVTHDQMRIDMKIMEHAFKSAELNQTIKFEY